LGLDLRQVLSVIGVPTLVVHHKPNLVTPAEHSRYLVEHIRDAQLIELERKDSFLFSHTEGDRLIDRIEEFMTGVPPRRRPDRVLATVLFTDIVASTATASRLGDIQWAKLLDRHDELLGHELEQHHGQMVASRGDGVLATFEGPERAVRCARSICESVRVLGIEIRAGIHAGEVQRRGQDIAGLAVHIGARVVNLAGAGEMLVSSTVKDLVVGSGIGFADRGAHDLKGVPGTWRLFAVDN
jgi:class 3 adenylate cyclase